MESAAPKGDTSDSPVREQSNSTASNIVVNSNGVETKIRSGVCHAMDTVIVEVESAFARGFAGVQLIGNVSDVCRNGKERARAALEDLGYHIRRQDGRQPSGSSSGIKSFIDHQWGQGLGRLKPMVVCRRTWTFR